MTISLPEEDRMYQSRTELQERICTCLGGRVAEELVLGDISTGASNDLQTATAIARSMVTKYGMSDRLGAISYDSDQEVFIGRSMTQARAYWKRWPASSTRRSRAAGPRLRLPPGDPLPEPPGAGPHRRVPAGV